jgi:hypothetical protein
MAKKKKTTSTSPEEKQASSHPTSESHAESDVYFENPHWLRACHNRLMQGPWLRGLILAAILVALGIGTIAIGERLFTAPSISKYLPADETVAYVEFNLPAYNSALQDVPASFPWNPASLNERLTAYLSEPSDVLPTWVGDHAGIAWVDHGSGTVETWIFLETKESPSSTEESFFESDPNQEWYEGDYLVMGPPTPEASLLWQVKTGERPALKNDPNFMTLRPALDYQSAAFFYMKPQGAVEAFELNPWAASHPEWQRVAAMLVPALPAMGMTVQLNEETQTVELETYWVGDKSLNNDEALFHIDQKYKGDLLEWLPTSATRFTGGEQLATTFDQITALLDALQGTGFLYEALLEQKGQTYFGQNFDLQTDLGPLFDNEYLLLWVEEAFTVTVDVNYDSLVAEAPILLLQLTEETLPHVETLVEDLLNHGLVEVDESTGTVTAASLTLEAREESGIKYNAFTRDDGGEFLQYLVQDDVLVITTHATEMKTMIDALLGDEETQPSFEYIFAVEEGVDFGDHVQVSLPGGWWGIDQLFSGFNLFDDGMSTWHEIQFQ